MDIAHDLLNMMNAETEETVVTQALQVFVRLTQPQAACLLIWDDELHRYIVGDTWTSHPDDATTFRRHALKIAQQAVSEDPQQTRCLEDTLFYQPLNCKEGHTGAYIAEIYPPPAPSSDYDLLLTSTSNALHTRTRLEQAQREHEQLAAERERLQHLLQAVEQQQRTIDRLLAAERQFSAQLETKVQERTAELEAAQKRLIQSEKLAVIGQLASSLAHELNNPLQAIQSGIGLMMNDFDAGSTDNLRDDLAIIQQELERIEGIFRQMLDFYRPVSYEHLPLELNAICEGVRILMRKHLQETSVKLHLELANDLPLSCGDSNQIKQVLLNLLFNAAEAMPESGGDITVRTYSKDRQVYLEVADNACGVEPGQVKHLFEPLFTTKTRGLGLGLAITQDIIERHRGNIEVESQPGVGTTFTVIIPVMEQCDE